MNKNWQRVKNKYKIIKEVLIRIMMKILNKTKTLI
jgi:hypothetical protein